MSQSILYIIAALAGLAAALCFGPAHADFYTLEGRFHCLDAPAANCVDMTPVTPLAGSPDDEAPPAKAEPAIEVPPLVVNAEQGKDTARDPILDIATRVEAGKPSAADMRRLQSMAHDGDGRAIELLAWCDYAGIGVPRDPVAAYLLYGVAAMAGITRASANQAVIFEYVLTPNQRQMVLDIQNEDIDTLTAK
jgi:hypothetical protein